MNQTAQLVLARPGGTHDRIRDFLLDRAESVRRSEWVILGFLVYAVGLGALLPVAPSVRQLVAELNTAILVAYAMLIVVDRTKPAGALSTARDVASLALILLAYREMGWFAQPHVHHTLETSWVEWDRLVLRGGAKAVIEFLGPVIPSALEIAYALVYALAPFAIAMLYVYKRRDRVDQFLFVFAAGVLLCYGQFPFWPSDPPRVVFAGQDLPSYLTVFRRFNLWTLGNYGIHTSVFPSAHVAGAFVAAFGAFRALPERRWVGRFLLTMACLIAVATVYGRYHYTPDAVAGLAAALIAAAVTAGAHKTAAILDKCRVVGSGWRLWRPSDQPHFPVLQHHATPRQRGDTTALPMA